VFTIGPFGGAIVAVLLYRMFVKEGLSYLSPVRKRLNLNVVGYDKLPKT